MTQNTLKKNDHFSIVNVLMQLSKVCNHPDLFDNKDYDSLAFLSILFNKKIFVKHI